MMMKVPFQRNHTPRRALALLFPLGLVLLVFLFGATVRDFVVGLTLAVPESYTAVPRSVLVSRLEAAEQELVRIRYQAYLYENTHKELQALKAELALRDDESYASARVVAQPPKTQYDTILVSAGEEQGVTVGDSVYSQGFLVGFVTQVSERSALVELYASPGSQHDVVSSEDGGVIVAMGLGGGLLEARVPGGMPIERGAVVKDVRTGAPFGVVLSVLERDIDTEKVLSIVQPVAPSTLRTVSLVKRP